MPYYLLFYPETQDLTLFHRGPRRYVSVKANAAGRVAIPEMELEAAILDGWVRYWYRGQLLPLTAELQRDLDALRGQLRRAEGQVKHERQQKELLLAQLRELGIENRL